MSLPPVLAVVGPTASGKSALALDVARRRTASGAPTEIVAVDAFTVYRRLDVGTAKPTPAERAEVAHHLVDVLDPGEELTVAAFQRRARATVDRLREAGVTPLLVGGSGLYWRAVVDPLRFPPTDPAVRDELDRRWTDDPDGAHAHLAEHDPRAAASIGPGNLRRTVRALEVLALTGEPFSAFDDGWDTHGGVCEPLHVGYLEPDGEVARARISERAHAMVDAGLVDEAAVLRAGPLSRTAAQAIGYAEAFAVLDGALPVTELADAIATRTWRYARRQRSWFRRDPRCTAETPEAIAARLVDVR